MRPHWTRMVKLRSILPSLVVLANRKPQHGFPRQRKPGARDCCCFVCLWRRIYHISPLSVLKWKREMMVWFLAHMIQRGHPDEAKFMPEGVKLSFFDGREVLRTQNSMVFLLFACCCSVVSLLSFLHLMWCNDNVSKNKTSWVINSHWDTSWYVWKKKTPIFRP